MIIDGHTHIHPNPKGFGEKFDASLKKLVKEIKKSKVDKAVVLPIYPCISNQFIANACKKYPQKLIGFASVDPKNKKAGKILEEEVKRYNFKGLKIHPRLQKICPSDKRVIKLAAKAASLKLPVLVDCFPQADNRFPLEQTFPQHIGILAQKVPEAKIILAHAGGYKLWDAFFIARANPNIYFDFSLSPHFFKNSSLIQDMIFILKKLGSKRCLHGSDYPEVSLNQALKDSYLIVKQAGFSVKEQEDFFGKTILSILPP